MTNLPKVFVNKLNLVLEEAIKEEGADMGNTQLYNPHTRTLSIIAQKGFKEDFLRHFASVPAFGQSACGRAIGIGTAVVFRDVTKDCNDSQFHRVAAAAGYRAVKSVPVLSINDERLGVLSVHFRHPQRGWLWTGPTMLDELRETLIELQQSAEALKAERIFLGPLKGN